MSEAPDVLWKISRLGTNIATGACMIYGSFLKRLSLICLTGAGCLAAHWLAAAPVAPAGAVDYPARLEAAKAERNAPQAEAVLAEWKAAQPDDPEHDIAAANYLLSQQAGLSITTKKAGRNELVIADKNGHEVGSIAGARPSAAAYRQAIDLLQEGLSKAPGRIDIHLGLATLYQESGAPKEMVEQFTRMTAYAREHADALLGKGGKPFPEPAREDLAHAISNFARRAFELSTKEGDETFRALAQLDIEAFPDREYGYNLMGVYYSTIEKNSPLAIENYRRALKLVPDDALVWVNVGVIQARSGRKKEASDAFEKAIALNNDPESVERAKAELARLK